MLGLNGPVDASQAAADSRQIRAALRKAWPGVGFQLESARWTPTLQLPSLNGGTTIRQIQLGSLDGLSAQATLTAGSGQVRRGPAVRCPPRCLPPRPASCT